MLECADRTLRRAIDHERFAGLRWHVVQAVAHDLGEALHRLRVRGIIYADFKPMNAVNAKCKQTIQQLCSSRIQAYTAPRIDDSNSSFPKH